MTPKQRVHAALNKEPTDRVPIFMWFNPDTASHLAELLEIPIQYVGDAMGDDIKQAWVNNNYAMEGITHERDGDSHVDFWGIKWEKLGAFNQPVEFPLAGASEKEMLAYEFPEDKTEFLLSLMNPVIAAEKDYFIGCDVSPCVFEMYWRLRGPHEALLDVATNPALIRKMFKRCADFAFKLSTEACTRFPLDWLWTGDDIGGQSSMLISPASWRELIKPLLAEIFQLAKSHHLLLAFHSCGSIRPIIGDLVEIGLDVLNPVQCTCPGMDPLELKKEFGDRLAFMGGVDTQGLLPTATAAEVRPSKRSRSCSR